MDSSLTRCCDLLVVLSLRSTLSLKWQLVNNVEL